MNDILKSKIRKVLKGEALPLGMIAILTESKESEVKKALDEMIASKEVKYSPNLELYKLGKAPSNFIKTDKDAILSFILNNKVYKENIISSVLRANPKEVRAYLEELVTDGSLYYSSYYDVYAPLKEAILSVKNQGYAFAHVEGEEKDYYISVDDCRNAYDGDTALIFPTGINDKLEGASVKCVTKRKHTYAVGRLTVRGKKYPKYRIESQMEGFNVFVDVKPEDLGGAYIGAIVTADLTYTQGYTIWGKVTSIVGSKDDPGIEISEIALEYGFKTPFSDETEEEIKSIPDSINKKEYPNRRDFTDKTVITIDGDDSKDFDDAVYLEKLPNGNYELDVHIADVSEYVREGHPLDSDALSRGTSVYLADRVIPMLPKKLSNGICSLNEGVDRLVLSCLMEYEPTGKLINYEITEGIIKSHHRMTYNKVNKMLEGDQELIEEYKDIYPMILEMKKLSVVLREIRRRKGAIEFESEEYKFALNEDGSPKSISKRVQLDAEKLIEDFMLAANETVAYHMSIMNLPSMYRIHEKPDQDKLHAVFGAIQSMGVSVKSIKNDIHPKEIQGLLESIKDNPNRLIINTMMLRSMMKAKYSPECLGHYGLAMQYYCHFTSPIRRYPDLITHRMIKKLYLHPEDLDRDIARYQAILPEIAIRNSDSERKSVDCERAVDDMLYAWYMESKIDSVHDAVISSITAFGMFAELSDGTEGLIAYRNMKGYFDYDEKTMSASDGNATYHLGDKVRIRVLYANRKERKIDFVLENENE